MGLSLLPLALLGIAQPPLVPRTLRSSFAFHSSHASHRALLALPRACRRPAVMCSLEEDWFANMKRADEASPEELRAVQIVCGAVGVTLGARIVGSHLVGLALGVLLGGALARARGPRGTQARELGAQLVELYAAGRGRAAVLLSSAREAAEARDLPEQWERVRKAAARALTTACTEARELDASVGASSRVVSWGRKGCAPLLAWSARIGLSARLAALWASSGGEAWAARFAARVEERRTREAGGAAGA